MTLKWMPWTGEEMEQINQCFFLFFQLGKVLILVNHVRGAGPPTQFRSAKEEDGGAADQA